MDLTFLSSDGFVLAADQLAPPPSTIRSPNLSFSGADVSVCHCPLCMGGGSHSQDTSTSTISDATDLGPQFWTQGGFDRGGGPASNNKTSFTIDQAAVQLTRSGTSWSGVLGTPATVSYAFRANAPATMPTDTSGFSRFNATQVTAAESALAAWSDVANITFNKVSSATPGSEGYADNATILFGNYSAGEAGAAAFAYFPGNSSITSNSGDVWTNSTLAYNSNPVLFDYGYQVLTHEVGHTIGLSHPGDYNADPNVTITYDNAAIYYEDSRQYSLMSYFASTSTGASLPAFAASPQLDDIAAAQRLYGANMTTRTGDTTYGFNSNAGRPWYTATATTVPVFAVWDAGGNDTLDFSGYGQTQTIDLRQGGFSSVGGFRYNVAVAKGAVIENAVGGSGADTLIGNEANNVLTGNAGDDLLIGAGGSNIIDGGAGSDTVVFADAAGLLYLKATATGFSVSHGRAVDQVANVEFVQAGSAAAVDWTTFKAASLNPFQYVAGYADLIRAIGADGDAAYAHFINSGQAEGRSLTKFDTLRYIASNRDLIRAFGVDVFAGAQHYVTTGFAEGRNTTSFDPLIYLASNADLARIFHANAAAGTVNYITAGFAAGRPTTGFNPLLYAASNADLARAFHADAQAALNHYLISGVTEGRATTGFDALDYTATYSDLISAFKTDTQAALSHYLAYGLNENRSAAFDPVAYLLTYKDLGDAGLGRDGALRHWITDGYAEQRVGDAVFGREQASHGLTVNASATSNLTTGDRDWFQVSLTAGQRVNFALQGQASGYSLSTGHLQLFDAAGHLVATDTNGGSAANATMTYLSGVSGTYYVVVSADGGGAGTYSLMEQITAGSPAEGSEVQIADERSSGNMYVDVQPDQLHGLDAGVDGHWGDWLVI